MRILKTEPQESIQYQADSPSIKAMRLILPIAALLSATSLAGGIAAFLELELTTITGICLLVFFAVAAFFFDGLALSSGQSVVRDSILAWKKQIDTGILFWINLVFSALICGVTVFGSFHLSKNGISFLVLEVRKVKEIRTQTDTTLNQTIAGATDQNAAILEAQKEANEAQKAAINSTYNGKIEALEAKIQRRQNQRNESNYQYIDNKIADLRKQIGEVKAENGEKLAELAAAFAIEQSRILSSSEDLQSVVIADAQQASDRRKREQEKKDIADEKLSALVSSIFSWSIILMVVIGLRLTALECRNGILPQPITTNSDLSGLTMIIRPILAVPYFVLACIYWISEQLYRLAPKKPIPTIDDDLVKFDEGQARVVPIRKESKQKPAAARREIGYRQAGAAANFDGQTGPKMTATNLGANNGDSGPVSSATENGENSGQNEPQKEIIYREVDSSLRDCIECGTTYQARAHNQKFCGQSCKTAHHQKKNGGTAFDPAKFHGKKF